MPHIHAETKEVFELRDCSDSDMFFPLGVFLSLDSAVDIIVTADSKRRSISDSGGESGLETIKVYRRGIGMTGHGDEVYVAEREHAYCEREDDIYWKTTSATLHGKALASFTEVG